jgi:hypothetical protein
MPQKTDLHHHTTRSKLPRSDPFTQSIHPRADINRAKPRKGIQDRGDELEMTLQPRAPSTHAAIAQYPQMITIVVR